MSAATEELTRQHRRHMLAVRAVGLRDLQRLWPRVTPDDADPSYRPFLAAIAVLLERDRGRANSLAATYLRTFREAVDAPGTAVIRLSPAAVNSDRLATSMLVTSVVAYRQSIGLGRTDEESRATAFVTTAGAIGRFILEAGRDTIRDSLAADPQAIGWRRVTAASACDWCLMLADRGAVYSARTAGFSAHDHCACSVEPEYGGARQVVRPYEPMDRRLSEATRRKNRERAKAWIADNRERLRANA